MPETPVRLAERLRREGQKSLEFFRSLPAESWAITVYEDGAAWSVRRLLAHFVSTEAGMQALARDVLAGGSGAPDGFDINAYNERKAAALDDQSIPELLARFDRLRTVTVELVAGLSPEDLQRAGRHPWLGVAPLEEIFKLLYIHNQIHQRDIRRSESTLNQTKSE
jgi:hypothetical protein